ncbi:MAG: response regulator [Patescibacteria group bacterium]
MASIALFDDNEVYLEILQQILQTEGHDVSVHSSTSLDSPGVLKQADIFLIDVWFGTEKAGLSLVKKLKQQISDSKKIILMSSDSDVDKYASEVTADGYIQKPFDIPKLLSMLTL